MSRLRLALGIAISVALFAYLLTTVNLAQVAERLRHTHLGWTAISVLLAPIGLCVRAARWRYLFTPADRPPGLLPAMMIGYMANNILPLRAGELVRVYVVARRWGRGFWAVLGTLVVERVLDSLAIVGALAILVFLIPVPKIFQYTAATLLAVDLVAVAILVTLAVAPEAAARLLARLTVRWPHVEHRATRIFSTFVQGLDGVRARGNLVPLIGWTLLVWVVPALSAWTMLLAMDLHLPLTAAWTVLAFVGLSISIPSAPGYVGVFHYAAVLALEIFGVTRETAVGYALLFHAAQIVPVTLIGWLFLLREHVTLREAARSRATERLSAR